MSILWPVHVSARRFLLAMTALAVALALACSGDAAPTPTPSAAAVSPTPTVSPMEQEVVTPILATTQLRVGSQRVSFLLASSQRLIKEPSASVSSAFLGEGFAAGEEKRAAFHLWPYGVRGAYTTELAFSKPGPWHLDIQVESPEGPIKAELELEVAQKVEIPEIGSIPPLASSKTIFDVQDLTELSSDLTPDPDLYQLTIAEAVISARPTVIVFATPAFCTSPTCGPQVDTVSELKELHKGEANFIHVELYDNPHEIQGDLSRAVLHSLVSKWGFDSIPHWFNESWTFILGRDGRIAHRFEGFVTLEEMEGALQAELTKN